MPNVQKEIRTFRDKVAEAIYESGLEIFAETPNPKAKNKSLKGSNLEKQWGVEVQGKGFVLLLVEYYIYIEGGRRAGAKPPPLRPILEWVKKNRIQFRDKRGRFLTFTSTAIIAQRGIAKNGIAPRPFVDRILERSLEKVEDFVNVFLLDGLLDRIIIEELDKLD